MMTHISRLFLSLTAILLGWGMVQGSAPQIGKDTLAVVAFGNSTTALRAGLLHAYPERLERLLLDAGITASVINAGVGGSHTGAITDNDRHQVKHARDRFEQEVLSHRPDWVIIWFGINDAWVDDENNMKPRISLEKYTKNLTDFANGVMQQGGRVILMTPNPLGAQYEDWRLEGLSQYRKATCAVAEDLNVFLIDIWQVFEDDTNSRQGHIDDLMLDGMHPNDNGQRLTAEAVSALILTNTN